MIDDSAYNLGVENERADAGRDDQPISRDQILRRERGKGEKYFLFLADHEQDWQPYPVDPYSAIYGDRPHTHTEVHNMHTYSDTFLYHILSSSVCPSTINT